MPTLHGLRTQFQQTTTGKIPTHWRWDVLVFEILNQFSLRCINLIAGVLGRAGESGQKKRIEAAATGKVTWQTPSAVQEWANLQAGIDKQREADRVKALRERNEGKSGEPEKIARTKEELLMLDAEVEPVV